MILLGRKLLFTFASIHSQSKRPLAAWEKAITYTNYCSFNQLKLTFPSADYVAHQYTIFDIGGNKYRLVSEIDYAAGVVHVKRIWTHAEYCMKKNEEALRGNRI